MDRKLYRFNVFVSKLLKEKHQGTGITGDALASIDNLCTSFLLRLAKHANSVSLSRDPPRRILGLSSMKNSIQLAINDNKLMRELMTEGHNSVNNFAEYKTNVDGNSKRLSRNQQAGLYFSVSRVERIIMQNSVADRKSSKASVFAAAVLEGLIDRILAKAVKFCAKENRSRITCRHLLKAIRKDQSLDVVFGNAVMSGGTPLSRFALQPQKFSFVEGADAEVEVGSDSDDEVDDDEGEDEE